TGSVSGCTGGTETGSSAVLSTSSGGASVASAESVSTVAVDARALRRRLDFLDLPPVAVAAALGASFGWIRFGASPSVAGASGAVRAVDGWIRLGGAASVSAASGAVRVADGWIRLVAGSGVLQTEVTELAMPESAEVPHSHQDCAGAGSGCGSVMVADADACRRFAFFLLAGCCVLTSNSDTAGAYRCRRTGDVVQAVISRRRRRR